MNPYILDNFTRVPDRLTCLYKIASDDLKNFIKDCIIDILNLVKAKVIVMIDTKGD